MYKIIEPCILGEMEHLSMSIAVIGKPNHIGASFADYRQLFKNLPKNK